MLNFLYNYLKCFFICAILTVTDFVPLFISRRFLMAEKEKKSVSLFKQLMLSIFTLGIYRLIWIARTTRFLNNGTLKKRDPIISVGLTIFVPFYTIYWGYRSAQAIDDLTPPKDSIISLAGLSALLSLVCPLASDMLLQGKINDLTANTDYSKFHAADLRECHVGPVKYIVLTIFTLGIYRLVRINKLTKALNSSNFADERSAGKCVALSIFVPFYSAYWVFRSAQVVDSILPNNRVTTTVMIMTALGGALFAELLLQDRVNFIADAQNG